MYPIHGNSLLAHLRLFKKYSPIPSEYWSSLLFYLLNDVLHIPGNLIHNLWYGRKIRHTHITKDPVFIIGFFRSGTSHLHNFLAADPQWGYITRWNAFFPMDFMFRLRLRNLRGQVANDIPRMGFKHLLSILDRPVESEFALCSASCYGFYHSYTFPKLIYSILEQSVSFAQLNKKEKKVCQKHYLNIIKCSTFLFEGKQIIDKSPMNISRIPFLLEMFPNAKFIHIYRNPINVIGSYIKHNKGELTDILGIPERAIQENDLRKFCLTMYETLMKQYFEDYQCIPAGQFVEVRYEQLLERPLVTMKGIYEGLNLQGFEEANDHFNQYLTSVAGFQPTVHEFSEEQLQQIKSTVNFVAQHYGYFN